ncbi:hypothetical protein Tco_0756066 [Tanacetum coccineum]
MQLTEVIWNPLLTCSISFSKVGVSVGLGPESAPATARISIDGVVTQIEDSKIIGSRGLCESPVVSQGVHESFHENQLTHRKRVLDKCTQTDGTEPVSFYRSFRARNAESGSVCLEADMCEASSSSSSIYVSNAASLKIFRGLDPPAHLGFRHPSAPLLNSIITWVVLQKEQALLASIAMS